MPEAQPAVPLPMPAPYGGINLRDGVSALQPFEARDLVNWEPLGSSLVPRSGQGIYSTAAGVALPVLTLAAYHGTATSKLIGVVNGDVWDFSTTAAVKATNGDTNFVSSRWQAECFNNRLIAVNGTETPWNFDGAQVNVATGFTGPTLTNLVNVKRVRARLWFVEVGTADAWYGTLGGITGALTKFQLSQIAGGGHLVAVAPHSQDSGAGSDDYTAFILSTGEVILYTGDPSGNFSLVGTYNLGAVPIGWDCTFQLGGALHIITTLGVIPLPVAMQNSTMSFDALGNFGKVGPGISKHASLYGANKGWFLRTWKGRLIVNVPTVPGYVSVQWVMLSQPGAWTRWEGFNAASMCEWEGTLYYGDATTGVVHRIAGSSDQGNPINLSMRTACSAFLAGGNVQCTALKFDMAVSGSLSGRFGIDADYISGMIATPAVVIAASQSSTPWGSPWGSPWGASAIARPQWEGVFGIGRTLGIAMEASTLAVSLDYFGNQLLVQQLGPGV